MTGTATALLAQAAVPRDIGVFEFLFDAEYWTRDDGILASALDTVILCSIVTAVATVIAVPLAAWLAHRGHGEGALTRFVVMSRAIPPFALAGLLVPVALKQGWGFEPWPIFCALLLMAIPPIYLNTSTAIQEVDTSTVDAARAMGFTETAVLFKVELALATGVILTGIRVAAVQVVATEPIRAYLGGDGLGRYVRDGIGQNNDNLLLAGAILVTGLALLTGVALGVVERIVLPKGVRRLSDRAGR